MQELITAGADPNIPDRHYWYPIHRASLWSHTAVMRILIDAGVDVNIEDDEGYRPMHLVAKWDHFEAAEILLAAKADVNTINHTKVSFIFIKLPLKSHF